MLRFERLHIVAHNGYSVENIVDALLHKIVDVRGVGSYPVGINHTFVRQHELWLCVEFLTFLHLELHRKNDEAQVWLARGVQIAIDYFYGDYIQYPEWAAYMKQSADNEHLAWAEEFRQGLFLATVAGDWHSAEKLADWITPWLPYNESSYLIKPEGVAYFKILAAVVAGKQGTTAEHREQIEQSRFKRAKLLLAVLDAIQAKDAEQYHTQLAVFLKYFHQREFGKDFVTDWISIDASTLVQLAIREGLEMPPLEEELADLVMTRETLGLET